VDGRRANALRRLPPSLPRVERTGPTPLPGAWALAVGAAWPVHFVAMVALAPEPADPNAVPSLVESLAFMAVMVGMTAIAAAAVARRSSALVWSLGVGFVWVLTTIACPLSGHHDGTGWQWGVELASSISLLLLSAVGLRVLRTR
jgi:hypothetical protein